MTKIKICGLQTAQDISYANELCLDYVGFVFAPSRRRVDDEQAAALKSGLSEEIQAVGVFVNDSIDHIVSLTRAHVIDLVQLHGDESEEYVREVKRRAKVPIIRAKRLSSKSEGGGLLESCAEYVLYDAFAGEGVYGGSGRQIDDALLPLLTRPAFVAGGLTAENVEEIIKRHHPFAVDVSSGVETDGKKDYMKMKQFVLNVRNIGGCRI